MDEINDLKDRVEFLENKYKELVEEFMQFKCMCNKPVHFHLLKDENEIKEDLLKRIDA